jgi:hypothetical protein
MAPTMTLSRRNLLRRNQVSCPADVESVPLSVPFGGDCTRYFDLQDCPAQLGETCKYACYRLMRGVPSRLDLG